MEMLQKPIKQLYFKYLWAAFGSALVGAVYVLVDMAIIGQHAGSEGTAAIALVLPAWSLICSLGLLTGIGGSVLYGNAKGENKLKKANEMFTIALIATTFLALLVWFFMLFFDKELLIFMGSSDHLLTLGLEYLKPLKVAVPFFVFSQMLAAFLRNDNAPILATFAVVSTSILNMILDYVFAFTFDWGIFGAALATAVSNVISVCIMLTHFVKKENTLRLVKVEKVFSTSVNICKIGFSVFFVDLAMGVMTMLYNKQILHLLNEDALAVYGAIASLTTVVQCCSYSIGQAAQPIISANFGAQKMERVKKVVYYGILTSIVFGLFWSSVTLLFPNSIIHLFMDASESVLLIAPSIMRKYCIAYLFVPFTLFATYYFQSILKPNISMGISLSRGFVLSAILLYTLPSIAGANSLWYATPITEIIVATVTVFVIIYSSRRIQKYAKES